MGMRNFYTGKRAEATLLYDLKGSNNGSLAGAAKPKVNANGYLEFSGGNGDTYGDYNRVEFNMSDFEYDYQDTFTLMILARSDKSDDTLHTFFAVDRAGKPAIRSYITTNESIGCNLSDVNGNGDSLFIANISDGKWRLIICKYKSPDSMELWAETTPADAAVNCDSDFYNQQCKAALGARYQYYPDSYKWDLEGDIARFVNFDHELSNADISNYNSYLKGYF